MGIKMNLDRSIANGDTANTKFVSFHNHSGTHVDFPNHFFQDGKVCQDYNADFWIFEKPYLLVKDVKPNDLIKINETELLLIPEETDLLLLKTCFSDFREDELYWKNNPGISPEVADQLRMRCPAIRVIGMDFISLTSFQNREIGRAAHREFLGKQPILLIEDMNLKKLVNSPVKVMCFPVLLKDSDGAPITVVAELYND
jgi:arylformamidase